MVLLTMTPAIVEALEDLPTGEHEQGEPVLSSPAPGEPISAGQLLRVWQGVKQNRDRFRDGATTLNDLLRHCQVHRAPDPEKKEQTSEYKALMARLRRDEETRAYRSMAGVSAAPPTSIFSSATPRADDEITYADADRQVALIFNVLVSIIACGVAIWVAARHWGTPQRLAFSMVGSLVVAVAEVGLYMLYLRRLQEAKRKERAKKESKSVLSTWTSEKRPRAELASGLRSRTRQA